MYVIRWYDQYTGQKDGYSKKEFATVQQAEEFAEEAGCGEIPYEVVDARTHRRVA